MYAPPLNVALPHANLDFDSTAGQSSGTNQNRTGNSDAIEVLVNFKVMSDDLLIANKISTQLGKPLFTEQELAKFETSQKLEFEAAAIFRFMDSVFRPTLVEATLIDAKRLSGIYAEVAGICASVADRIHLNRKHYTPEALAEFSTSHSRVGWTAPMGVRILSGERIPRALCVTATAISRNLSDLK